MSLPPMPPDAPVERTSSELNCAPATTSIEPVLLELLAPMPTAWLNLCEPVQVGAMLSSILVNDHFAPAVNRNSALLPEAQDAAEVPSWARTTVRLSVLRAVTFTISHDDSMPGCVSVNMKKSPPVGLGNNAPVPAASGSVVADEFTDDASVLCALLAKSCAMVS